jgi:hypothetical protein
MPCRVESSFPNSFFFSYPSVTVPLDVRVQLPSRPPPRPWYYIDAKKAAGSDAVTCREKHIRE